MRSAAATVSTAPAAAALAVLLCPLLAACVPSGEPPPNPAANSAETTPTASADAPVPVSGQGETPRSVASPPQGRWRNGRSEAGRAEMTPELREQLERLEAIGYLAGSAPPSDQQGVVVHDEERARAGLNFYTSGHAPEAVLMDMTGEVLHRWRYDFRDAFPDAPADLGKPDMHFWRKAHLFPNGDVLAIHEGLGLVKVDRRSRLLWARAYPVHHDLEILPGGEILVLTRVPHLVPEVSRESLTLEDFVTLLSSDGEEKDHVSLLAAFENAAPDFDWRALSRRFWELETDRKRALDREDIFHTNALRVLDGDLAQKLPAFGAGNYLVSMCHLDTVAVVDPVAESVVWAMTGPFALQHDPRITADGRLLVFDNHWQPGVWSRVLAIDPLTRVIEWEYRGSEETPFFSATCGAAHPLDNGNVLVVESDNGRTFELTRSKEIVWEFRNPARAGPDDRFVATIFDLERIDPDYVGGWLHEQAPGLKDASSGRPDGPR